ncbi:hypothetical protein [Flavihumibacter profundi]|uniref:hypothetical protein n=1 Tax=Flavihumibacter profundi TaxID=2716883 RepID=UPI001CC79EE8|nr:hypothetical protein [Flavihumibacter profundi]MBZ5857610.1 hypothetical protein [Flavihumibacter profundi]
MNDEIVSACDRCGKPIPKGSAYVCISRNIEQIEHNIAGNEDEVQVIDAEIIIALCGSCGNKFDTGALQKLVQLIPWDPEDRKKN